jgi:hypothetical protein
MIKKLTNPFENIAGAKSLIWGVLIILFTSIIGYFSNTHFPGIISVKTSPDFPVLYFIIQGFLNWLVVSTFFYFASILFSKPSVRAIDIYGTQALSRTPYLPASFIGFSGAIENFGKYLLWNLLQKGEPTEITTVGIIAAILLIVITLLLTIWQVVLMFNAFKVSANLKGNKLTLIFIGVLIASMIASSILNNTLFQKFN